MQIEDLESLIRRDPARRGILASPESENLCRGHLAAAADSLRMARKVGIVTGFYVPDADPPAAETDGLSGAVLLADVLSARGADVLLVTDELCRSALNAGLTAAGCRGLQVVASPLDSDAAERWREEFRRSNDDLTHLLAIERAGPSYTLQALNRQPGVDPAVLSAYEQVPAATYGRCQNVRGIDIHATTADLHLLFEERTDPGFQTIGICDGGNEIGAGTISWFRLKSLIAGSFGPQIACRTATDWTIPAGVSDWGAMALAAALCLQSGDVAPLSQWPAHRIERLLQGAVRGGPAIDGITRRSEATVDGLPFITYIQPWLHIRWQLGLEEQPFTDLPEPAPENRVVEHP